jgi:hypothetical protein
MKKTPIENYWTAIPASAITTAIPPPVRDPIPAPEARLAMSATRASRLGNAMAKVEVFRAMLHTRSIAPLRLSHELGLILTGSHGEERKERETSHPRVHAVF